MKRIGLDIGSTTVKYAIADEAGNLLRTDYRRHRSRVAETLSAMLTEIAAAYPDELVGKMTALGVDVRAFDTLAIAREAGSEKASNVALIGLADRVLGFDGEILRSAVLACVPEKAREINARAFDMAYAKAETANA